MSELSNEDAARLAVLVWGVPAQLDMVLEEIAELVLAIQHHKRGRVTVDAVAEEVADVRIMLRQVEVMLPQADYAFHEAAKWERLKGRLAKVEADQGIRERRR